MIRKKKRWKKETKTWPIQTQLISSFILTISMIFVVNFIMFFNINKLILKVDHVYLTNVSINELSDTLHNVQNSMTDYLNTKSTSSIETYFLEEQNYREELENLQSAGNDSDSYATMENIKNLSETYLDLTEDAVQAKRGHVVEKYKDYYDETLEVYDYINAYIYSLNNSQFENNATDYYLLTGLFHSQERMTILILVMIAVVNVVFITIVTRNIMTPVREKELMMEAHLKEAELKYLQGQINPHFLFNTLNAGAQLALLEGADRTSDFMQNVSLFYRYKMKKNGAEAKLIDEIALVDNYLYILNVRYTGEIHYEKEIDNSLDNIIIPGMVLQPVVENAVNHGIQNVDHEKKIKLKVYTENRSVIIKIIDNGIGMTQEEIVSILAGESDVEDKAVKKESNGVGLKNVIARLSIFYGRTDILSIYSKGIGEGTTVCIEIPLPEEEKGEYE